MSAPVEIYDRDGQLITVTHKNSQVRLALKRKDACVYRKDDPFAIRMVRDGERYVW